MPRKGTSKLDHLSKDDILKLIDKFDTISQLAKHLNVAYGTLLLKFQRVGISKDDYKIKYEDITGKKFGYLKVIRPLRESNKDRSIIWECVCVCKKIHKVSRKHLSSHQINSCGCRNKGYGGHVKGSYFSSLYIRATKKKIEFKVDCNYLNKIFIDQNKKCALTGEELYFGFTKNKIEYSGNASLDRIDSSKGYIEGNLQWVHKDINKMKMDLSMDRFKELCEKVSNFQGENIAN